jgi:hypothetical protein
MSRVVFDALSSPLFPGTNIQMNSATTPTLSPDATLGDFTDACAAAGLDAKTPLADALEQLGYEDAPASADPASADPATSPKTLTSEQRSICKELGADPREFARVRGAR